MAEVLLEASARYLAVFANEVLIETPKLQMSVQRVEAQPEQEPYIYVIYIRYMA